MKFSQGHLIEFHSNSLDIPKLILILSCLITINTCQSQWKYSNGIFFSLLCDMVIKGIDFVVFGDLQTFQTVTLRRKLVEGCLGRDEGHLFFCGKITLMLT